MIKVTLETVQLERFVDRAKGRLQEFVVEVINDICEDIVTNTPVKTGFLRGSWYGEIESGGATPPPISDTSGGKGLVGAVNFQFGPVVQQVQIGDTFRFTNGAEYAVFVEYGTSRMAPRAMVRSAVNNVEVIANDVAARMADEG